MEAILNRPKTKARATEPAPESVIRRPTCWVENPKAAHSILDPCAGEGAALAQLAAGIPGSVPYANEIDPERYAHVQAEHRCCGPVEHLRATNQAFSLLYLNPPFDNDGQGDRV